MALDLAIVMPWITAALSIIAFLTAIKNILGSPTKELNEKAVRLEAKIIDHDRRIQKAENDIAHMPDRETFHRVEMAMEKISGRLDTLDERLKPIGATNQRLQEFLLEKAKQ